MGKSLIDDIGHGSRHAQNDRPVDRWEQREEAARREAEWKPNGLAKRSSPRAVAIGGNPFPHGKSVAKARITLPKVWK